MGRGVKPYFCWDGKGKTGMGFILSANCIVAFIAFHYNEMSVLECVPKEHKKKKIPVLPQQAPFC